MRVRPLDERVAWFSYNSKTGSFYIRLAGLYAFSRGLVESIELREDSIDHVIIDLVKLPREEIARIEIILKRDSETAKILQKYLSRSEV